MYVIDPGHPNQSLNPDSEGYGAVYNENGTRLEERSLTWEISKKIQQYARDRGVRVELTRDRNEPTSLTNRCGFENELKPELFVSLHFNWFGAHEPRGSTIFHYENSGEGKRLAESIEPYFEGYTTIPHRRTRITESERDDDLTPYFYVLTATESPAVLLELAFLSNPDDRAQITNNRERFTSHYAKVIYGGIRYFSLTQGADDDNEY